MASSVFPSLALFVIAVGFLGRVQCVVELKAVPYDMMGLPPNLTGVLEQNNLLSGAEQYKLNQLKGPESFVYDNGHIYTGLSDGRIVDISDCGVRTLFRLSPRICQGQCARPLGLRLAPNRKLIIADSVLGIISVHLDTGAAELLFNANTPVNGRKCRFINDVVVARDGTILFTDSSTKWTRNQYLYIILEGESSGRLIALGPKSKKAIVVLDKLSFPNGLEFGPDEEYLLIAETSRARIRKLDLRKLPQTWLKQTWFAFNLPGLPDNIRSSGRGTFWVAMSTSRNDAMTSSRVDQYADKPEMRNMIAMMAEMKQIEELSEKYGTIVEMDIYGNIIRTLQDPTGERISGVSEVLERDGYLYLGSYDKPYVSRVPISPKFDVDRFLAKIKSTCRAQNVNLVNLRRVLRQMVAIAEFRKALLNAKRREEEARAALSTTTSLPPTVNSTDETTTVNTTDVTDTNATMPTTTEVYVSTSPTTSQTTTLTDDSGPTLSTTTFDPEAGDPDTAITSTSATTSDSTGSSSVTDSSSAATGVTVSTTVSSATSSVSSTVSAPTTQTASTGTNSATASTTQTATQPSTT